MVEDEAEEEEEEEEEAGGARREAAAGQQWVAGERGVRMLPESHSSHLAATPPPSPLINLL